MFFLVVATGLSPLLRLEDRDGTLLCRWVSTSLEWVNLVIDR
jgi:hypothetical protein